jgi:hypothetical protein
MLLGCVLASCLFAGWATLLKYTGEWFHVVAGRAWLVAAILSHGQWAFIKFVRSYECLSYSI